jgi:hypothetical protein
LPPNEPIVTHRTRSLEMRPHLRSALLSSLALIALIGVTSAMTHRGVHAAHAESRVVRWERTSHPIRVWIQGGSPREGWTPAHAMRVWDAFATWSAAGAPVRVARAKSAREADVLVEWVPQLPGRAVGKTWREDEDGAIIAGRITLAYLDQHGRALPVSAQTGVLLHEIGHLLGLSHSGSQYSVMYPELWSTELAPTDRAALIALYSRHVE